MIKVTIPIESDNVGKSPPLEFDSSPDKNSTKLVGGESNEPHLEMLIDVLASGTFLNAVSQYKAVTMSNSSIQIQGSLRNFM